MFSDEILNNYSDHEIRSGEALCWVIEEDVLYDINVNQQHAKIFLESNSSEDVSETYPDHEGIVVRLYKDGIILDDFATSEYFGSILLSNPTVVNLSNHKNGRHVISPYAKFINYEFIITNGPVTSNGWYEGKEPPEGQLTKCYSNCNCGRIENA